MISSIRHRGLKKLYQNDDARGIRGDMAARLQRILTALNRMEKIDELRVYPGWRLHSLKGDYAGYWSVSASGNWRVVFRFEDGDVSDVDLVDYH